MAEIKQRRVPVVGWLVSIGLIGFALTIALPFFAAGMMIHGEEFSPQLFQKREFTYWRIPGTQFRVSQTTLTPGISPSGKDLLQHLPTSSQIDWHLSSANQGMHSQEFGPKILIESLQCLNADGVNRWDAWSSLHPNEAKLLWPLIQQVAQKEMYFCIPDLLRCAQTASDLNEMNKNLRKICLGAAKVKLKTLADAKNAAVAMQLRNWGQQLTQDFLDDPEIQELGAQLANPA